MSGSGEQLEAILGDDPVAAAAAARELAEAAQRPPTNLSLTVYDRLYREMGRPNNYINTRVKIPRRDIPTGNLTLLGHDPLAEVVLSCDTTVVPINYELDDQRVWTGRVLTAHDKINEDGSETVECDLIGNLAILDAILVFPDPGLPIEFQPLEAMYTGPAITVLKTMVAENAFRIQSGLNEFLNQLGSLDPDWRTWLGTLLADYQINLTQLAQMCTTPVCVIWDDGFVDTSNWINIHGKMDSCWKLMKEQLDDNGLYATIDMWMPGDPQPVGRMFDLTVPTYIFNVRDYSNVTGPTNTVFDGGIKDAVNLIDSVYGKVAKAFLNPNNAYVPPGSNIEIAPAIGVNFVPPWTIFNADIKDGGIVTLDVAHHHPLAWKTIIGGRSPQWLNAFFNATSAYLIDLLTIAIGVSGIPSDMLDGIIDNAVLAFESYENFDMRVEMGPYGFPEKFFPTQSTYNVDATFAGLDAQYQCRGYPAIKMSFYNGQPFRLFRDIWPAAMSSVVRRGVLYTDVVDEIEIEDSRESWAKVTATIGDGRREDSSAIISQRKIVEAEDNINLLLLASPGG
ncbi:hypothetical protein NM962_01155 [Mycobacterium sp. SVM_VP21]|nr:hypothetical protein NM962_01155 [Mycobacterium sp. SVM_VP21]